ncbi:MAG: (S)-2,3-di-O-geranylgeranylglyceryl phosphate synthase [Candidatus Latescibacteria bacterium ADurb.Bin168]|nr:MAG: (S)-2,3-di-O-geranylgeranylglyceryl phosphate synthase [Candidatus Latescibacteria bacterium ADurb.Bin168]
MAGLVRTSRALLIITRPANVVLTAVSVAVGASCSSAPAGIALVTACACAALIAAGGYVANDCFDVETDRINRPYRPIPSGALSRRTAVSWAVILFVAGVSLSWFLPSHFALMATVIALALVWYAAILKRTVLWGHVLVATISGSAFVFGGMLGTRLAAAFAPALLAAAFHLGREMLKAAADYPGDMEQGYDTIAVRRGVAPTCRLASIPLAGVIALSPIPFIIGWFGFFYLIGVIIVIDGLLAYVIERVWRSPESETAARMATLLKWGMVAGIATVWGDVWTRSLTGVMLTLR